MHQKLLFDYRYGTIYLANCSSHPQDISVEIFTGIPYLPENSKWIIKMDVCLYTSRFSVYSSCI